LPAGTYRRIVDAQLAAAAPLVAPNIGQVADVSQERPARAQMARTLEHSEQGGRWR
jgi:hypothetical protein